MQKSPNSGVLRMTAGGDACASKWADDQIVEAMLAMGHELADINANTHTRTHTRTHRDPDTRRRGSRLWASRLWPTLGALATAFSCPPQPPL